MRVDPGQGWRGAPVLGCTGEILTDSLEEPLGLIFPRDPKEVDRQATENYAKANATLHRGLPEGDGDQEQAGQDEEHREYQAHLGTEGGAMVTGSEQLPSSRHRSLPSRTSHILSQVLSL